ncbi:MAG: glycoside hydrolase family 3 C-terminal domain-containing protein [Clostridia bacterium]|nr:glycoside hydrolase family 3 C-terminal domain-containing protein [Clostridia bacterium]
MNIKETLEKMTLDEKISLLIGKNFWETRDYPSYGIPSLFMSDGPSGLRKQNLEKGTDMLGVNRSVKATAYPAAVNMASTWDRALLNEQGRRIAYEAKNQKIGMVLGPGINIKRNPLCGRNFEYMSEDPVLAGNLASEFIKGLQGEGISCSLKHFACNDQELKRFQSNSIMDERTLREIYLKGFEIAVKNADPKCVMSSYNSVNGEHASDSRKLLNDILRDEWGFSGMVVSDWGGMSNRIKAIHAGNDLCMPGGSKYMHKEVKDAVESGKLDIKDIDSCCERIIERALSAEAVLKDDFTCDYEDNHRFAADAAKKSAVLLKNDGNILPLAKGENILFAGAMVKHSRYQGAGSSRVNAMNPVEPYEFLKEYDYTEGCSDNGDTTEEMLKELRCKAQKADTVVVFAGLPEKYESEGFDRSDMSLPEGHLKMIEEAVNANPETVVVLFAGAPVEVPFADKAKAILYMGLPGEAVGEAVYDLLFGNITPSGRLAESWPMRYSDVISSDNYLKQWDALYMEGIYVGYRYYDKAEVNVRYPFGFGLSYGEVTWDKCSMSGRDIKLKLKNETAGALAETVQLYTGEINPKVHRPVKELKDFRKVYLEPGEEKEVTFTVYDEYFSIWKDGFTVPEGDYRIFVCKSVSDIMYDFDIHIDGISLEKEEESWYSTCKGNITKSEWEKMLGFTVHEKGIRTKGNCTMEESIIDMKDYSFTMKLMYKMVTTVATMGFKGEKSMDNPEYRMIINSSAGAPLRAIEICGGLPPFVAKYLLKTVNRKRG